MRPVDDYGCGFILFSFCLILFGCCFMLFGNHDLWNRELICFGNPSFCDLFTPTNPLPGHRLVPELQVISRMTFLSLKPSITNSNEELPDFNNEDWR